MTYWTALVNNLFIFTKEFLIPLDPVAFLFFVFFSSSDFLGYYQVWRKVLIKQPNSYLFNCYKFPFYATIKYEWSETKKIPTSSKIIFRMSNLLFSVLNCKAFTFLCSSKGTFVPPNHFFPTSSELPNNVFYWKKPFMSLKNSRIFFSSFVFIAVE